MKKEVEQKNVMMIFGIFVLIGILFSYCIYNEYYKINKINVDKFSDSKILLNIDSIENNPKDKVVNIRGWAFKQNENLKTVETYVALKNIETKDIYKINTIKEVRNDVTLHFNDSYNYDNSGFFASFDKHSLKRKGEYELCIIYLSNDNTELAFTGKILKID